MKRRKLVSKLLATTLALSITLPYLPQSLPQNLIASADDYSGGGSGGNSGVGQVNNGIDYKDYGIRIYAIDQSGTIKTGNGANVVDLWNDGVTENINTITSRFNGTCRFGTVDKNVVYTGKFNQGIKDATHNLQVINAIPNTTSLKEIPKFAWFANSTFNMSGATFKDWATSDVQNSKGGSAWNVTLLYYGLTDISLEATDFLVIEPIMYAPIEFGAYGSSTFQGYSSCTWYGFVKQLGDNKGAAQMKTKAAWGNGFTLEKGKPMAGLNPPTKDFTSSDTINQVQTTGWGLHILKSEPIGNDPSTPIDTYDITSTPQPQNTPSNPETPSEDNKTDGEKTIIKVYADLYKDPNTGYYTQIENIVDPSDNDYAFIQTDTSNRVSITNEEQINGYKVSAWYTSNTKYDPASSNNDLLKASNMISTTNINIDDNSVSLKELGGNQFRINQYQAAYTSSNKQGYNADGGQHYYVGLQAPHGANGQGNPVSDPNGSTNYTNYKRLAVTGNSNYGKYDYQINEDGTTVDLSGDENTIVILYTREKTYIQTNDIPNSDIPDNPDDRIDQSGNLTIV